MAQGKKHLIGSKSETKSTANMDALRKWMEKLSNEVTEAVAEDGSIGSVSIKVEFLPKAS